MSDLVGSKEWWHELRHGPNHTGLGDVRVTIGMQEEITGHIEELEAALEEASKGLDYYEECLALRKENDKLLFCHQWVAELQREIEKRDYRIEELERALSGVFICGMSTNKDTGGLPDSVTLCPKYGSDYTAIYKKVGAR